MKERELYLTGKVRNGSLMLPMQRLNDFVKDFEGKTVTAAFRIMEPGASEALKGYYYHSVVPQVRQGFTETGELMTDEATERHLRSVSPVCSICTPGDRGYIRTLKEIEDMSNAELCQHIEFIRMYAAEHLQVMIDDPSLI